MNRRSFIHRCFQSAIGLLGIGCTSKAVAKPLLGTPLNKSHPLARGLVGCELMNEGHFVSLDWRGFHLFANHSDNVIGICGCGRSKNGLPDDTTIALPTLDVCQDLVAAEDSVYWIGKHELWRLDWHYGDVLSFSASLISKNGPFQVEFQNYSCQYIPKLALSKT